MLTLKELNEILEIDLTSSTGLRWKVNRANNQIKPGDEAGSMGKRGYCNITINYKQYHNHRVIYALYHNLELDELPKCLDHIDKDKRNNNPTNLRTATVSQNNHNTGLDLSNKSGYKGVSWCKREQKWIAHIRLNGKSQHLGYFDDIEDASKAYQRAAIRYFGEFADY